MSKHGRLKVPADIAELIPVGTEFQVEISEAGLLFKPAEMVNGRPPGPTAGLGAEREALRPMRNPEGVT